MSNKLKIFTAFAVFLFSCHLHSFAQELLSNTVSKDTILIGDQVLWTSRMQVPRGTEVKVDSMSGYVVPGVELLGDFRIDTVKKTRDYSLIETKALITSVDSGSYMLPPLVLYLSWNGVPTDTLRLTEIPLEVTTIPIDTAKFEMYDLRPQFRYPVTFGEVASWVLGALVLTAAVFFIWKLLKKRKNAGNAQTKPKPGDPPHIVALKDLERIRREELWQKGRQKQFYTEVTEALRKYIEDRFGIRTLERTSNEILDDLSSEEIAHSDFESLKGIFSVADLVKFAKYQASKEENEETVPNAIRFVNDTVREEKEK